MSNKFMAQYLAELKQLMPMLAEEAMLFPKSDAFEHGVQVGKWQGLHKAMEVLTEMIDEEAKRYINS